MPPSLATSCTGIDCPFMCGSRALTRTVESAHSGGSAIRTEPRPMTECDNSAEPLMRAAFRDVTGSIAALSFSGADCHRQHSGSAGQHRPSSCAEPGPCAPLPAGAGDVLRTRFTAIVKMRCGWCSSSTGPTLTRCGHTPGARLRGVRDGGLGALAAGPAEMSIYEARALSV